MPSFELKPQVRIWMGTRVDDISWTVGRDRVPILLEGRGVSLSVWQKTFDEVWGQYDYILGSIKWWFVVPCCICCSMPYMMRIAQETREEWKRIVSQQEQIYRAFGVQVTLALEMQGLSSSREVEPVGLRFDIATVTIAQPAALPPTAYGAPAYEASSAAGTAAVDDIVSKLERLKQLHATGALSDSEYASAKNKLLSS